MFLRRATISVLLLISLNAVAQVDTLQTLHSKLTTAKGKTKVDLLNDIAYLYTEISVNSAEDYANQALEEASQINYKKGIARSYNYLGICNSIKGDHTKGLDFLIKSLQLREQLNDSLDISNTLNNISRVYIFLDDLDKALDYSNQSLEILKKKRTDAKALGNSYISHGEIYLKRHDFGRAYKMFAEARAVYKLNNFKTQQSWALLWMAIALEADGKYYSALLSCFNAEKLLDTKKNSFTTTELYQTIGSIYSKLNDYEGASKYLYRAKQLAFQGNDSNGKLSSLLKLLEMHKHFKQYDSALYYHESYLALYKEVFNAEKSRQMATLEKIYQTEKKDQALKLKNETIHSQSIIITISSMLLVASMVFGVVIYRYYQNKKKSNLALEKLNIKINEKHEEILAQAEELTQANEEISRINESLEEEVKLRTEKIERQNQMLIDYAFTLAHKVRGPLARILGLSSLMKRESSENDLKEYNSRLYNASQELDAVIKEINTKLHDDE